MDCDRCFLDPELPNHGNPQGAPWTTQEDNQMETNALANSLPMVEYPPLTPDTQNNLKKVTTNGHQTSSKTPTDPLPNSHPPTNLLYPTGPHQPRPNRHQHPRKLKEHQTSRIERKQRTTIPV